MGLRRATSPARLPSTHCCRKSPLPCRLRSSARSRAGGLPRGRATARTPCRASGRCHAVAPSRSGSGPLSRRSRFRNLFARRSRRTRRGTWSAPVYEFSSHSAFPAGNKCQSMTLVSAVRPAAACRHQRRAWRRVRGSWSWLPLEVAGNALVTRRVKGLEPPERERGETVELRVGEAPCAFAADTECCGPLAVDRFSEQAGLLGPVGQQGPELAAVALGESVDRRVVANCEGREQLSSFGVAADLPLVDDAAPGTD